VAHLRAREARRASNLRQQINDRLPADINVLGIKETTGNFHARHDAVERFYLYQISTRRRAFSKPYVWWIKDSLDVDAMGSAAQMLLGRHDFAGFCEKSKDPSPTVVEVTTAELCSQGDLILFRIGASHYVWKMVRRLVGVLAEVGRRHLKPEDLAQLVAGRSAPVAQWTAPPSGLFLEYVRYHGEKKPDPLGPAFILL
jgi:tRNA pseudouridine38-40 synthase